MISETTRKEIINLIWRGYSGLDIIKEFAPTGDRAERQLSDAVAAIRSEIAKFIKDVPALIELGLRNGFSAQEVFDTIDTQGEGLIPRWNLEVLISGVAAKLDEENRPAREAAEKVDTDAKKAAIEKQIADATAALRAMGAPVGDV